MIRRHLRTATLRYVICSYLACWESNVTATWLVGTGLRWRRENKWVVARSAWVSDDEDCPISSPRFDETKHVDADTQSSLELGC